MKIITINTDGGARGNPGPAGIGIVVSDGKNKLAEIKEKIGETTNNVAEYRAVIKALDWLQENIDQIKPDRINFNLDSMLIVNQIIGKYRIKQEHLKLLNQNIQEKIKLFNIPINFNYIPRTQNKISDKLVNQVLDEKTSLSNK
ncbi:ribonuclease H [Candidatus Berkelbacteria bacterium CG_4_8_14_3_um_filter_33_6]|uniref:Ribonuclease H n=1 Tax=Candidatus Berkelbacteria bacterium CG_4_10_14_0_2_um_filter_35_9_33_12 TaxID=1974499 RepID=A0A2M7W456_9BACT|nr:MAG: ribonuclease H [Candidatus Berkelbacteria bacterium CG23_combo_of_CG06-09_8_20_14_all_33_15]PIS08510.1 MAG: ribonuclease H [Candidatus Berkelbacteria bacterium CG10_big_fil_rev_8_21_14_0_10_33_10]PIX30985.1 MAG: ribonuclease H [Candidatus Berkelbacteria bacterium CG_4_8_14_3_um_filter_33_6]PIZ28418.1 MAG: ribonuclease H [Candidatus Berkelbacteria bacterium CG_4_10_14_0_8_um_filter_35_9_33_8]PJA20454.1 MAG: ribonuclease H [Candidatus Berkelbacteria bacterium CG_4_10_14_0_2_um_filter_35_9